MTSAANYTPGPWSLQEQATHPWIVLCPTNGFPEIKGKVCEVGYLPNARLIAAAPEMLEALDHIGGLSRALRQSGPHPMDLQALSDALEEAVDLANALVRKATGAP